MEPAKLFFRENPFPAAPSSDRYLAIGSIDAARIRLMEMIDRREGLGLIVGPAGTGKSLLCALLASAYESKFDVILLSETRICTRKALLQHLLHHLGLPFSDRSEGELRLSLIDRSATGGPDNRSGLLIIVDEAQTLPGRLLEELRMMSGIVRNGSPRVQLVLAGGPSLDERLSQPRMEALSQRIGARCYLHPLGQQETDQYVRDSIRWAGADPATALHDNAIESIYYASNGIPRIINQTLSRAISIAQRENISQITSELVDRAWADLQQLPCPIIDQAPITNSVEFDFGPEPPADVNKRSRTAVVEFGPLDNALLKSSKYDPMAETTDYDPATEIDDFDHDAESRSIDHDQIESAGIQFESEDMAEDAGESVDADQWHSEYDLRQTEAYQSDASQFDTPKADKILQIDANDSAQVIAADCELTSQIDSPTETESTSAEIIDCSPKSSLPPTEQAPELDLLTLFGDGFEDEQVVSLHSTSQQPNFAESLGFEDHGDGDWTQSIDSFATYEPEPEPETFQRVDAANRTTANNDIEQALHDQILAINSESISEEGLFKMEADTNAYAGFDADSAEDNLQDDESIEIDDLAGCEHPFSITMEIDRDSEQEDDRQRDASVLELHRENVASDHGFGCDISVRDDSDMLIIEDDLEIDPAPEALSQKSPRDNDYDPDDNDFQSIFSRLREG
jgi:type II secretory pathway predicted ATPase ExeA